MPGIGQPYTQSQKFPQGTGTPYFQKGELIGNGLQINRAWAGPRTNGSMATPTGRVIPYQRRWAPPYAKNTVLFTLSGVTKDSAGSALGNCRVLIFNTHTNEFIAEGLSDGSGNYSITVPTNSPNHFVVSYKAGSPDVAGTTKNNLLAS